MLKAWMLGKFEVQMEGRRVDIPARPAQTLLAFLLLHPGTSHRREFLAGLLWPESDEESARANLRTWLWHLRKAIDDPPGLIVSDRVSISFNPKGACWLDVEAVAQPFDRSTPRDELEAAVSQYGGELLPGLYDDWVLRERDQVFAAFEQKLQRLLDLLLQEKRWSESISWCERWLALDQASEPAYRALMNIHAAQGEMAKVSAVYKRCTEALKKELDVPPSAQTMGLFEQLQRSPHVIPSPAGEFAERSRLGQEIGRGGSIESFLTPVLVGRSQELNQLENALEAARDGVGRCVLVSGEAGIGKSRLLTELRGQATDKSFNTFVGRCFEQDMALPYAPLIDMLRTLFARRKTSEILDLLGPQAPEFAKLLPGLTAHISVAQPAVPLEPESEKRRLFEALANFFLRQAETRPLVLIVEDLHWSDAASINFLLFLIRRITPYPILLLLSYRPAETNAGLLSLLTDLDREPIAQTLKLKPLTRSEVEQMLRSILDQQDALSAEFLEVIYSLTDGNPFFTEEIFTSLIASGDIYFTEGNWRRKPLSQIHIPGNVQRLVQQRVGKTSQTARQLLDLAAVSGPGFDFTVLQKLTGHNEKELLVLVKELISAQLVIEESADQFAFRHALTREALYGQLLVRERQALHGQLVQAIEQIHTSSLEAHLEALAYHAFEAALWTQALDYAQRAGEKALALFAPQTAVEQFTRALTAAGHLNLSPPPTALYRLRGKAFDTVGEFDPARADYEAALQTARTTGDQRAEWQSLLDLGLLWASRDYDRTGAYSRQALDLARLMEDQAATGYSLNRLGNWLMNSGQPFEALRYHREALDIFETIDNRAGIAATLDLLAMTSNQSGDTEGTVTYWQRAIPILRELNDRQTLSSSLANVVMYTLDLEQAHEAIELARDIGWRSGEAYALGTLSQTLFTLGRYGEALTIRAQSLEIAQAIEHPQWMASGHIFLGLQHAELLALAKAQEQLEQGLALARQVGSLFFVGVGSAGLASVYILQGRLEAAESLLAELPQEWIPAMFWARLAQAELAMARQDATRMLQLLDDPLKVPLASEKAIGVVSFAQGPVLTLYGQALTLQGRLDEAEQVLHRVRNLYMTNGIAQSLWKIHLALGKLYLAADSPEQAEESFTAARAQIDELAATLTDEDLRENFRRRANALIPSAQPPTHQKAIKREYGGLTGREREVVVAVAQGLSNQAIADELVVTIKTVESHITHILSKLGFSSRAQIAAWAVDKGLASAPQDLDSLSSNN